MSNVSTITEYASSSVKIGMEGKYAVKVSPYIVVLAVNQSI